MVQTHQTNLEVGGGGAALGQQQNDAGHACQMVVGRGGSRQADCRAAAVALESRRTSRQRDERMGEEQGEGGREAVPGMPEERGKKQLEHSCVEGAGLRVGGDEGEGCREEGGRRRYDEAAWLRYWKCLCQKCHHGVAEGGEQAHVLRGHAGIPNL